MEKRNFVYVKRKELAITVGYNEDKKAYDVIFPNGRIYTYTDVTLLSDAWTEWLSDYDKIKGLFPIATLEKGSVYFRDGKVGAINYNATTDTLSATVEGSYYYISTHGGT